MKWILIGLVVLLVLGTLWLRTRRPRRTDIRVDHRPDSSTPHGQAAAHLHANEQNLSGF